MAELEPPYRNDQERALGRQLKAAGIDPSVYESRTVEYTVPARTAKYLPDFPVGNIIVEFKGYFGGDPRFYQGRLIPASAKEATRNRNKLLLIKEQHPELDIRIVFQRPNTKIYPGSKTTYAQWATDHGFKWAKGKIPDAWIKDLKHEQERLSNDRVEDEAKCPSRPRAPRKARKH